VSIGNFPLFSTDQSDHTETPLLEDVTGVDSLDVDYLQSLQSKIDKLIGKIDKLLLALEGVMARGQASTGNVDSKPEGRSAGSNFVNTIRIAGSIAAIVLTIGGTVWGLHSEFSMLDKRMGKLEIAMRIVAEKQGGDTKELVNDALAVVRMKLESGQTEQARSALSIANKLMAAQKSSNVPLSRGFFEQASKTYSEALSHPTRDIHIMDEAFRGSLQLAEYRSAINIAPNIGGSPIGCSNPVGPLFQFTSDLPPESHYISGITIMNCSQPLDDAYWNNVAFVDCHISYNGGAVILKNVIFVRCTFEVTRNDNTEKLLQCAALDEKSLQINPEVFAKLLKHS
jgi:hypothetical protein